MQTDEITGLITDVGDDCLAEPFNFDPLSSFVCGHRWLAGNEGGTHVQMVTGNAREAGVLQVCQRPLSWRSFQRWIAHFEVRTFLLRSVLITFMPAGHKIYVDLDTGRRDVDTLRKLVEVQHGFNRGRLLAPLPIFVAAFLGEAAR